MTVATPRFYVDVSDRSLLALDGADGLDLLQRISTNDVAKLKIGEHAETILTTEKGRIVDLLVVFRVSADSLILAGASKENGQLSNWIGGFIVMEDARLSLLSDKRIQILVLNLRDEEISSDLINHNVHVAKMNYLGPPQALFVAEHGTKAFLQSFLERNGIPEATAAEYESYRILNAIPGFPNELSTQYNPLEVGLQSLVSFTKGCYVGQEVIARLETYQKVQKSLRRLRLSEIPAQLPSDLLSSEKEKVGVLTSCTMPSEPDEQIYGLGLVSLDNKETNLTYPGLAGGLSANAELVTQ